MYLSIAIKETWFPISIRIPIPTKIWLRVFHLLSTSIHINEKKPIQHIQPKQKFGSLESDPSIFMIQIQAKTKPGTSLAESNFLSSWNWIDDGAITGWNCPSWFTICLLLMEKIQCLETSGVTNCSVNEIEKLSLWPTGSKTALVKEV